MPPSREQLDQTAQQDAQHRADEDDHEHVEAHAGHPEASRGAGTLRGRCAAGIGSAAVAVASSASWASRHPQSGP
jgi:hypothetical protein